MVNNNSMPHLFSFSYSSAVSRRCNRPPVNCCNHGRTVAATWSQWHNCFRCLDFGCFAEILLPTLTHMMIWWQCRWHRLGLWPPTIGKKGIQQMVLWHIYHSAYTFLPLPSPADFLCLVCLLSASKRTYQPWGDRPTECNCWHEPEQQ